MNFSICPIPATASEKCLLEIFLQAAFPFS